MLSNFGNTEIPLHDCVIGRSSSQTISEYVTYLPVDEVEHGGILPVLVLVLCHQATSLMRSRIGDELRSVR
jgi:hypothetical protein